MRRKTKADFDLVRVDDNPRQLRVVRHAEIVGPEAWELPTRATTPAITAHVEGSYTDRAKGFSISTWQLSTVTGLGVWIVAGLAWYGYALPGGPGVASERLLRRVVGFLRSAYVRVSGGHRAFQGGR